MIYLDTSAAVPLFVREPASDAVDRWISSCKEGLAASDWLVTEFSGALAVKTRTGQITARQAKKAWSEFEMFCNGGLRLLPVSRAVFRDAGRIVRTGRTALRGGDALHIAAAMEMGATSIATLDALMAKSANHLGLRLERIA
ncbi:MAG: type II toxin-antitoxin system VapC family toxin [Betaproteobacteria bacterium]|nr:type II toxin-antitoxin system VapC family toxin [Betaproteobacteria bacterium]